MSQQNNAAALEKFKPAMSALNSAWFAFECGVAL